MKIKIIMKIEIIWKLKNNYILMDIEKTIDNTINLLIHIDDKNKTESLFDIGMNFYIRYSRLT